jgi:hypothetical protein
MPSDAKADGIDQEEGIMTRSQFKTPVDNRYFEDYEEGSVHEFGSITVEEEEIISFGRRYDPQVFHTDPVEATKTAFGGLSLQWLAYGCPRHAPDCGPLSVPRGESRLARCGRAAVAQASVSPKQAILKGKHPGDPPFAYKTGSGHRPVPCGGNEPGSRGSYELEGDEHASVPGCPGRYAMII